MLEILRDLTRSDLGLLGVAIVLVCALCLIGDALIALDHKLHQWRTPKPKLPPCKTSDQVCSRKDY